MSGHTGRLLRWKTDAGQIPVSPRNGAAQVVRGIAMPTGKTRAAVLQNSSHPGWRKTLPQQLPGHPFVGDTPVRLRETLRNMQPVQAGLVEPGCRRRRRDWHLHRRRATAGNGWDQGHRVLALFQQSATLASPARRRMPEPHPGRVAVGQTPCRLLIGKTGQATQMTPIGASRIPAVSTGQVAADSGRHRGWQGNRADADPDLPMPGTAFEHDTGFMSVVPHAFQDRWTDSVQVYQDIAGILIAGKWLKVNIAALAVADAQKAQGGRLRKLRGGPQAFAGKGPAADAMNEANQVEFAWHGAQLPLDGMPGEKQSVIDHKVWQSDGCTMCLIPLRSGCPSGVTEEKVLAVKSRCRISALSQILPQSNAAK